MSKYILIPDSFKGSLSSGRYAASWAERSGPWSRRRRSAPFPWRTAERGTVDAFLAALGGEKSRFPAGIPMAGPSPPATAFCRTAALP